jgi:hypothetical protein
VVQPPKAWSNSTKELTDDEIFAEIENELWSFLLPPQRGSKMTRNSAELVQSSFHISSDTSWMRRPTNIKKQAMITVSPTSTKLPPPAIMTQTAAVKPAEPSHLLTLLHKHQQALCHPSNHVMRLTSKIWKRHYVTYWRMKAIM